MKASLLLFASLGFAISLVAQTQICGVTKYPTTPTGKGTVVNCPGASTGSCRITLSFLRCLDEKSNGDPAIRMNPGDLVIWESDELDISSKKLKTFKFKNFNQVVSDSTKGEYLECSKDKTMHRPFSNKFDDEPKELRKATTVHPDAEPGTCFKHSIDVYDSAGNSLAIDPHVIIGDGTQFLAITFRPLRPHKEEGKQKSDKH